MNTIIYPLKPGGMKGQMNREERIKGANKYIEFIESEGRKIISKEFLQDKVIIITED